VGQDNPYNLEDAMNPVRNPVSVAGSVLLCLAFLSCGNDDPFSGVSPAAIPLVSMKLSGPGAVNNSTIKAGENVLVDIYIANDTFFTGFSLGFTVKSPMIKNIIHVIDSGNGLNENGDIKGYNGWQDKSIWDFGGVFTVEHDWDGELPEVLGFGGLCIEKQYLPHDLMKVLSFEMIVPDTGLITVDSSFFPPGGRWIFLAPPPGQTEEPNWLGPYTFKVVK